MTGCLCLLIDTGENAVDAGTDPISRSKDSSVIRR